MHQAKLHCLDVAWSVIGRSTPVNLFWPKAREVMRNGSKLHGPVRGKFACLNLAYPLPFDSEKDSEKGSDTKNDYYRFESPEPGASSQALNQGGFRPSAAVSSSLPLLQWVLTQWIPPSKPLN